MQALVRRALHNLVNTQQQIFVHGSLQARLGARHREQQKSWRPDSNAVDR
jgi:hypothetical protein